MNKTRFRIIFNKARGMLMAVAEHVASAGKSVRTSDAVASGHASPANNTTAALKPTHFAVLCHLGLVSFISFSGFVNLAHADIIADPTAPANQRPVVINAPNGVPLVNIQTPSAAGVSRNTYSQFDVNANGAILNNSRTNVQTQLGGWVQGNPYLATGSARIILNEVNSHNPSLLNGYVEVAGNRAQVVFANPAGISCNGCGFINASRTTLTTGTPIMNNGDLMGYRVGGGVINFLGAGLDTANSNYTDVIARAVNVNAGLWAQNLNMITGSNQVNVASNGDVTGITAISPNATLPDGSSNPTPGFAIDVAALGGMYAGKIHLIGTEAGLGVRNAGEIGASVGEFTLTTDGQLINTGKISATTQNSINVQSISNTGGSLTAGQLLEINANSLTGDGSLLSGGNATVTLSSNYTQTSTGELQANGNLTFTTTGNLTNQGRLLAGGTLSLNAANIDNTATAEITGLNTQLNASNTLTNRGLIDGDNTFITTDVLNNIGTGSIFGDHIAIAANTLNNLDETVNSINTAAVIAARSRLDIGALTINNQNNALMFSAGEMAIGGALDVNHQAVGTATTVNNVSASIEALGDLDINAATLTNKKRVFSMVRQVTGTSTRNYQECVDPPDCDYIYHNTRTDTVYQDVVTADSPIAKILAGANAHLTIGDTINEYSTIAAGLNLNLVGSSLLNQGAELYQQTDTLLTKTLIHWGDRNHGTWTYPSSISLLTSTAPAVISAGEALTGSFTDRIDNVSIREHSPIGTLSSPDTTQSTVSALPQSSLFQTAPSATAGYFIETNPRFASYRNWLSSDYMLSALALDPALTQKRLGDGFYEQRLIREQIGQLTGRRFLTGYANDEAQYQALMMNGVTFAQAHQLVPGVALSATQVAQLTSDIVWLVEQTVTLPDGSQTQALVPQLYVRLQAHDLNNSGALLAGDTINLNLDGELNNNSTIAGRQVVNLSADNINNIGGRMQAGNQLMLSATHDINMVGTTSEVSMQQNTGYGTSTAQLTQVNRVAGLYVTNPNGVLVASAGHDINLKAAEIKNLSTIRQAHGSGQADSHGTTLIDAGNNLNLGTLTETSDTFGQGASGGRKGYRRENISREVGTVIQTDGDLTLNASNNLTARAANVTSSKGVLNVIADNDISIEAGKATYDMEAYRKSKSSGTLSSKSSVHRDTVNSTDVISSTFSGNNVNIAAGNNLAVKASNIVGTNDVNLDAGNNVTLTTEQATHDETHYKKTKKTGFSAGGSSIGYGTSKLTNTNDSQQVTNVGSTVGSVEGDVNINAGLNSNPSTGSGRGTYNQTGSDVLTPQGDINIAAQQVNITNATDTYANQQSMKYKQSGITLAVTNPVISAIQTAQQMSKAAGKTDDPRMQALAAGTAALSANNAKDAIIAGNIPKLDENGLQVLDANGNNTSENPANQVGGINVSLSIGTSKSSSKTTQTNSIAKSSTLNAGGDVTVTATGAGKESDINVIGSTIKAANDVTLKAEDEINLLAAQNADTLNGKSKGSSASLGVSFGTDGLLLTAGASGSKGKTRGNGSTWTETQIQGGNPSTGSGQVGTVTLESGTDTTLKGAQVTGNQVVANVGTRSTSSGQAGKGNLTVQSLQDTDQYKDKQQSIGGSVSVGYGKMGGSFNYSDSKTKSNYQSVNEQSGIMAGDGGFQVNVNGNTDLKGAVIASTDKAIQDNKNSLTTQTLTTGNIANSAEYEANAMSMSVGGGTQSGKPTLSGAGVGSDSGDASSVTVSGISGGTVSITDPSAGSGQANTQKALTGQDATTTVALLNRDVKVNANGEVVDSAGNSTANTIAPIFDAEKVAKEIQAQVQITQAFGQQAGQAVETYVKTQRVALQNQLKNATTDAEKTKIKAQMDEVTTQERVMNVLIGAVTGMGGTALTKEGLSVAADQLRQIMIEDSKKFPGVTDGTTVLTNTSGESDGVRGDGEKVGGTRVDLDKLCGPDNKRCAKNPDGSLALDAQNRVVWTASISLADFLETDQGKEAAGATGGIQGWKGTLFGTPYVAGSWQDKLIESFGGTHDFVGGRLSGLYDEQGNATRGRSEELQKLQDAWSASGAIVVSTPFAMAEFLQPEVWQAISVLLKGAK